MKFSDSQKALFKKNFKALPKSEFSKKLSLIKNTKIKLIAGKDNLDINLLMKDGVLMYENPLAELNAMLALYDDKYLLYPHLYFYGFGNGVVYKALLQNKHHKHILVFEENLELVWLMFHILDFSKELQSRRLLIGKPSLLSEDDYYILGKSEFYKFSRVYFLELQSNYYEKFKDEILQLNEKILKRFIKTSLEYGNDVRDALQGLEQFVFNLPKMLTHPSLAELLRKRANKAKTAIVVSTGPSLIKQLPLLKQYAKKASIFCADSAYPILQKHNIKPDYVLSLERVDFTSEFFREDFKEFDKDITFIIKALTHKNTINYLENVNASNRSFMLYYTPQELHKYLKLNYYYYYYYYNAIPSVANLGHFLSYLLGHKQVVFIGQDLAYTGEDKKSHPQGYLYGEHDLDEDGLHKENIPLKAYGGQGEVISSTAWLYFKQIIEEMAFNMVKYGFKTYNATEGGASIEHTIEKPFKWCCEHLLEEDLPKPFEKLDVLTKDKQDEYCLKAYARLLWCVDKSKELRSRMKKYGENVINVLNNINNLESSESRELLAQSLEESENLHEEFDKGEINAYVDIFTPWIVQYRVHLAKNYVLNPKTEEEALGKLFFFNKEEYEFFQAMQKYLKLAEHIILENIIPLEEEIKQRKLDKYLLKLRAKYNV